MNEDTNISTPPQPPLVIPCVSRCPSINFFNVDCIEFMKSKPDKCYDLAIVDPEFGIGIGHSPRLITEKGLKAKEWDNKPIDMNYFTELFRISKNQIIWGGNYYALPPTKHCIIWDKMQPEGMSFGMFDFAWTSFDGANKMFKYSVQKELNKRHPTQKPVQLYRWLLNRYATKGMTILDTHGGSFNHAIAAEIEGFDLDIMDIDSEYYQAGVNAFNLHKRQQRLF